MLKNACKAKKVPTNKLSIIENIFSTPSIVNDGISLTILPDTNKKNPPDETCEGQTCYKVSERVLY